MKHLTINDEDVCKTAPDTPGLLKKRKDHLSMNRNYSESFMLLITYEVEVLCIAYRFHTVGVWSVLTLIN